MDQHASLNDNSDTPLWCNMNNPQVPLDYIAARAMLMHVAERAGLK